VGIKGKKRGDRDQDRHGMRCDRTAWPKRSTLEKMGQDRGNGEGYVISDSRDEKRCPKISNMRTEMEKVKRKNHDESSDSR
jgi:hypothetical protein